MNNEKTRAYEFKASYKLAWLIIHVCYFALFALFSLALLIYGSGLSFGGLAVLIILLLVLAFNAYDSTKSVKKLKVDKDSIYIYSISGEERIPFSSVIGLYGRSTTWRYGIMRYVIKYSHNGRMKQRWFTHRHIKDVPLLIKILRARLKHVPQKITGGIFFKGKEHSWAP